MSLLNKFENVFKLQEVAEEINEEIARSDEKLLGAAPTIETDIYPREVELTKRESELDRKISKYENDHREYLDRRRELEIWFNEANERFEHVRISGETMSQQIAQVNDHNQHLQSENGSLSHKLEVLNTKYNDLENSIKNSSTSVAESSELTNLTIERLRAELQRAMESLHHKDRICEELKHTIAELQEERIISQKFTRKSFNIEEDVHSPPSSLNSTIIDMDESGGNEVKSTELSSTSQPIFVNDEYTEEILERLRLTEKEKLNLQSENMALNDALSMEQRKRYDVEQELKTANEVLNLDFTSQDKSDIFGGTQHTNISSRPLFKAMLQAPLMTPECTTGHQVSKFSLRNSPKPAYGAHIWYHYDFISLNVGTSGLWQ
ncbi:hypothetical protein GQR58_028684 [Nymphon striatum]|nr:hypothetical protein GQR58_028684 [Nymphon striatum]